MSTPVETQQTEKAKNASERIFTLFMDMLDYQFSIDNQQKVVTMRSASDYANELKVHVNHLNRAVKDTSNKTTSYHIASRILYRSKDLLRNTNWNVCEIAILLGFNEATHFNNFFKKHTQKSPTSFRSALE